MTNELDLRKVDYLRQDEQTPYDFHMRIKEDKILAITCILKLLGKRNQFQTIFHLTDGMYVTKENDKIYVVYDEGFFDIFDGPPTQKDKERIYDRIMAHKLYRIRMRSGRLPWWYNPSDHSWDIYAFT